MYAKNQDDIDALLGLVQEYSKDIGMEFGMDKCAVLGVRDGKQVECRGVVLPSGDEMKEVDEEGYTYILPIFAYFGIGNYIEKMYIM